MLVWTCGCTPASILQGQSRPPTLNRSNARTPARTHTRTHVLVRMRVHIHTHMELSHFCMSSSRLCQARRQQWLPGVVCKWATSHRCPTSSSNSRIFRYPSHQEVIMCMCQRVSHMMQEVYWNRAFNAKFLDSLGITAKRPTLARQRSALARHRPALARMQLPCHKNHTRK